MGSGIPGLVPGVSLADLLRGLPVQLNETRKELEALIGPLANTAFGFTTVQGAANALVDALEAVVHGLEKVIGVSAQAEESTTRFHIALNDSKTATAAMTVAMDEYNDAVERNYAISHRDLEAIETKGLALGVNAAQLRTYTLDVEALAQVTGNLEGATRAVALAYEGHFSRVSRLLGPVTSLTELEERLATGRDLLAAKSISTAGAFEGLSLAVERLERAIGDGINQAPLFSTALQDLRIIVDRTTSVVTILAPHFTELTEAALAFASATVPVVGGLAAVVFGAHEVVQAVGSATVAQVNLNEQVAASYNTPAQAMDAQFKAYQKHLKEMARIAREAAAEAKRLEDEAERGDAAAHKELSTIDDLRLKAMKYGFEQEFYAEQQANGNNIVELKRYVNNRVKVLDDLLQENIDHAHADAANKKATAAFDYQFDQDQLRREREVNAQKLKEFDEVLRERDRLARASQVTLATALKGTVTEVEHNLIDMGKAFGSSDAEKAAQGLTFGVLKIIGQFATLMGNAVIFSGIAGAQLGNPITAIPAGIALAAAGTAILAIVGGAEAALSGSSKNVAAPSTPSIGPSTSAHSTGSSSSGGISNTRNITVIIGNGAVVGGDGRAVGRDIALRLAQASPSWSH